jgi:hypothetical protein
VCCPALSNVLCMVSPNNSSAVPSSRRNFFRVTPAPVHRGCLAESHSGDCPGIIALLRTALYIRHHQKPESRDGLPAIPTVQTSTSLPVSAIRAARSHDAVNLHPVRWILHH